MRSDKGSDEWSPSWKRHQGTFIAAPTDNLFKSDDVYIDAANPLKFLWHRLRMTGKENQNLREQETATPTFLIPVVRSSLTESLGFKNLFSKSSRMNRQLVLSERQAILINFGNLKPKDQLIEISTRRRIFAPHSIGMDTS